MICDMCGKHTTPEESLGRYLANMKIAIYCPRCAEEELHIKLDKIG